MTRAAQWRGKLTRRTGPGRARFIETIFSIRAWSRRPHPLSRVLSVRSRGPRWLAACLAC